MQTHSKKIILAILALFLVGVFWRFATLLYFPSSGSFLEKGDLAKLHAKETLQQVFTVDSNNLAKVEIILRSPGLQPGDQVEAKILDAACQKTIASGELSNSFLSSNNLYEFSFPIIPNSQHQTYCLALTFDPQSSSSKSLQFFYRPATGESFNNISAGLAFPDQTLSFRLVYKNPSSWENLTTLNQRISQYKPFFLKANYLVFIVSGFLLFSLTLIIMLIIF